MRLSGSHGAPFRLRLGFDWSDEVDESGEPFELLGVVSAASPEEIHEAYLAFMRAWVREVPPERRKRIRVAFRAGVSG